MKRSILSLLTAAVMLLPGCSKEQAEASGTPQTGVELITSVVVVIPDDGGTRISITPAAGGDPVRWKQGDRLLFFEKDASDHFTGASVEMKIADPGDGPRATFRTAGPDTGLVPGRKYLALHPGRLANITPPAANGSLRFTLPQTIVQKSATEYPEVEDNDMIWTNLEIGAAAPEVLEMNLDSFNNISSTMEFNIRKGAGAGFDTPCRIASMRAATTSGRHFGKTVAVDGSGNHVIEEFFDSMNIVFEDTPLLTEDILIARVLIWWDQAATTSEFVFSINTTDGKQFTAPPLAKNSVFSPGKVVRRIPVTVTSEPSAIAAWDGSASQPADYNETAKTATIANAAELAWLAQKVNGTAGGFFGGWRITLNSDINLDGRAWTPIGTTSSSGRAFQGTFDGNGYKIYGLSINAAATDAQALFGYCNNAAISNLSIESGSVTGRDYCAGICAYAVGTKISYCRNRASITGQKTVGGIVALSGQATVASAGGIACCENSGSVSGTNSVGGIVGQSSGINGISMSVNKGSVTNATGSYAGGIAGQIVSSTATDAAAFITGCRNEGGVTGKSYNGGIAGYAAPANNKYIRIVSCVNSGAVNGLEYTGGIAGYAKSQYAFIRNCLNVGTVGNTAGSSAAPYFGGIAGYIESAGIAGCRNAGNVTTTGNNSCLGGIAGVSASGGCIAASYNTGDITASGTGSAAGGITAAAATTSDIIAACYSAVGTISAPNWDPIAVSSGKAPANCYHDRSSSGTARGTLFGAAAWPAATMAGWGTVAPAGYPALFGTWSCPWDGYRTGAYGEGYPRLFGE